jgi:hypothetical protein
VCTVLPKVLPYPLLCGVKSPPVAVLGHWLSPAGEFEVLSKPVGVPLVAFRLKQKTDEDGEQQHG